MYTIDFNKPSHIYFVGIGGISMSGLAEILVDAGFKVSGDDWHENELTKSLEEKGVAISYGPQVYENITEDIDCVVFTAAVHADNPEYIATTDLGIPFLSRAELLGQIMKNYKTAICISGTHGKTTTTSMVSEIFLQGNLDPTLSIGGIYKSIGGNIRVGKSDLFVTEACEYTNSFLSFFPTIGAILNIEANHLDFFTDIDDIRNSFRKFASLIPANGTLIINGDIPRVSEITQSLECNVITYSISGKTSEGDAADYFAGNISYDKNGHPSFDLYSKGRENRRISLSVPGMHNISNALCACAIADAAGSAELAIKKGLLSFAGTDRRFEYKGVHNGVTIIDDYAHHPTEINATLTAAAKVPHNRLWCVFQSHTYSRTKALMDDFASVLTLADEVILADIYSARETDNLGISAETLQQKILDLGHSCHYFKNFTEIENFVEKNCINGDMLITMGAGDVYKIGDELLNRK